MASHSSTSSFNEQKIFFKKLLIFIILFLILDQVIGRQLEHALYNLRSGRFGDINLAINEKSDILIFGASKAHHNYNPRFISKDLDLTCFNLGADGTNIIYHYTLLNHIIKYYKPKLIIYDLGGKEFNRKYLESSFFSILMPYIKNCKNVLDIIQEDDKYIYLKLLSRLYPFNHNLHSIVLHGLIAPAAMDLYGYEPLLGSKLAKELMQKETNQENQQVKIKIDESDLLKSTFISFIEFAKQHGVPILFVNSPVWDYDNYYKNCPDFPKRFSDMITSQGMKFIMIQKQNNPAFNDELLFIDSSHLNKRGTRLFSIILNNRLKQLKGDRYF